MLNEKIIVFCHLKKYAGQKSLQQCTQISGFGKYLYQKYLLRIDICSPHNLIVK